MAIIMVIMEIENVAFRIINTITIENINIEIIITIINNKYR